jgi:hypothetical protein
MAKYEKKVRAILSEYGFVLHRHGKGDQDIRSIEASSGG